MEYTGNHRTEKSDSPTTIKSIPEAVIADVKKQYAEKCKGSIVSYERAKKVIPAGLEHNLGLANPYPLTMKPRRAHHLGCG
jgi:glutamate-1-semialdehyde 2,1-aminomutase